MRAGEQVDFASTERCAGEGGGTHKARRGVLGARPDFEAGGPIGAEVVRSVGEEESAVAILDQLAAGSAGDLAFEDALVGRTEGGANGVAIGAEGGGACNGDPILREVQVDRRIGSEISKREVVDPLHDR